MAPGDVAPAGREKGAVAASVPPPTPAAPPVVLTHADRPFAPGHGSPIGSLIVDPATTPGGRAPLYRERASGAASTLTTTPAGVPVTPVALTPVGEPVAVDRGRLIDSLLGTLYPDAPPPPAQFARPRIQQGDTTDDVTNLLDRDSDDSTDDDGFPDLRLPRALRRLA